jgi:hypothetical protein
MTSRQTNCQTKMFELQFPEDQLRTWAEEYDYAAPDGLSNSPEKAARFMKENGCLDKSLFVELCRWKSPRPLHHYENNGETFVREVTREALSTPSERLRIEILTLLDGVSWPTASVILHFGHEESYPILDFRAFWSLGFDKPPRYDFDIWWEYVQFSRNLSQKHGLTVRELDKALWKYSKDNQQ